MRTFTLGSAAERKIVTIELSGSRMRVTQKAPDGTTKRNVKELNDESQARSESDRLARDLVARGYVERLAAGTAKPAPTRSGASAKSASLDTENVNLKNVFDDDAPAPTATEPVLPRLTPAPMAARGAESTPKKKKKGTGKKKQKRAESSDALDKRVLAGIAALGLAVAGFFGYMAYDAFLKPPTIIGTWAGSMIDFEIGKPIIHTEYRLVLDENKHASLTLQDKFHSMGTYAVKGNRLKLSLKDQDVEEGEQAETVETEYKIALGRATLDLYDPATGKQKVQLLRFLEKPVVGAKTKEAEPSQDLAAAAVEKVDKAADDRLVSVEFSPKDTAFKLRYPPGWETDTGSRPDNTYSWGTFTHGSAKVQVYADIKGSLMSGSDSAGQYEEGSELAPVHRAHELYRKTAAEEYSDYKETKPTLFKGAPVGEGRIAEFTASTGGLLGSKVRGFRATFLTNDRRISVLCQCPPGEFSKLKPTFLALCRSVSR